MIKNSTNLNQSKRHWRLKEKARELRARGLSYQIIIKKIGVSKSTISLWCRDVKLTTKQQKKLYDRHESRMTGIKIIQSNFWHKRCDAFWSGTKKIKIIKLTKYEHFLSGLMIYWAEGTKQKGAAITNSDPRLIKFMVNWFWIHFNISPQQLSAHLHLHTGQDENEIKKYWTKLTGIPLDNFQKSFIKKEGTGYKKNKLYYGTIKIKAKCVGSTYLLFQILGALAQLLKQTNKEMVNPEDWMSKSTFAE